MDLASDNQNLIGIFTTDADFVVQVWDAAVERMTGISSARALGKSVLETIPNLETRGLMTRFRRVMEEGTVEILAPAFHRFLIPCPPRHESKHFAEMRQRVTIAPLTEDQTIRGLIVSIEDVTERMERELEMADQLTDSDETVRLRTAKTISREPESLGEENAMPVIKALGDKNWRVRRELIDGLSQRAAPDAIAALLRALREQHFDFALLNSALQVLQATSVETTEPLIEFLRGDDADLRMQAALSLGEQQAHRAVPALLAALEDENANVRYHAIEALGKLKAPEAVEPLLAIAETRDFFLSFAALEALRQIADESIAKQILPLLNDEYLRQAAVDTLGAIGDEEIVPPLVNLLNEDKLLSVAVAGALNALFERCEKDLTKSDALISRARRSVETSGKSNLLAALGEAGENELTVLIRLAGWFEDEKIRQTLDALIENENVRQEAARSLARQGRAGVDLLIERLAADDVEVRRTAALMLGQTGDGRAIEPLIDLLVTETAAVRQAAVEALKSLAHPETVSRLSALLLEAAPPVREAAIRVVGYFGAPDCQKAILECVRDEDERIRKAAVEQLSNIEDESSVSTLIQVLRQDLPRVRAAAAQSLAQIKTAESVAALREALGDADSWVRYFAARGLGALEDAGSREKLAEMAEKDAAEHVRVAADEVLSRLKA